MSAVAQRLASGAIYVLSTAIGVAAFLSPFFSLAVQQGPGQQPGAGTAPLLLTALVSLCFVALLFEVQGQSLSAKSVALLGVLVAINAALRFAEVAVPGPGGFSPIFLLIIMAGYVYGAQFGFLMGATTLLVSAVITGGVGPWLPYQMFVAGWMGLTAPALAPLVGRLGWRGRRGERAALALFGALWGFGYGAIMNLWFWPYASGPAAQYWAPGVGAGETLRRYLAFYALTSLAWDVWAAIGNVALIVLFGAPILRALRRFHDRLSFVYQPEGEAA